MNVRQYKKQVYRALGVIMSGADGDDIFSYMELTNGSEYERALKAWQEVAATIWKKARTS
jgi:predicted homoserine dehydrogenase-like protein